MSFIKIDFKNLFIIKGVAQKEFLLKTTLSNNKCKTLVQNNKKAETFLSTEMSVNLLLNLNKFVEIYFKSLSCILVIYGHRPIVYDDY